MKISGNDIFKIAFIFLVTSIILFNFAGFIPALAEDTKFKWHSMDAPGYVAGKNDMVSPCEVNKLVVGSDSRTFYAVDIAWSDNLTGRKALYKSVDSGISWHDEMGVYLYNSMAPLEKNNFCIWNIDVAVDDTNCIAVVTNSMAHRLPRNIWFSRDGGLTWTDTKLNSSADISSIAISSAVAGNKRSFAAATRTGTGTGMIYISDSTGVFSWIDQGLHADILAIRFSPGYADDNTLAVILSDNTGTCLAAGTHDFVNNSTDWSAIYNSGRINITTGGAASGSARADQLISADLELPAGFKGQTPGLRKYFISIDSPSTGAGIYRIDNVEVIQLMVATSQKRIGDISFSGSIDGGKLLAGEVLGNSCSATVMTWLTDKPFICGAPCWFPAIKPATGAAGNDICGEIRYANVVTGWSPDGSEAYAATGSTGCLTGGTHWALPYLTGSAWDESAFSISRNNANTWNQLALIDTCIDNLIDIAPSPDGSVIYLASINDHPGYSGFDSVWRSNKFSSGINWERVLCIRATSGNCTSVQSNVAILRMAGNRPQGDTLLWAAQDTRNVKWTGDHGDHWMTLNTDAPVQDIAFEDDGTLYMLTPQGIVQQYKNSGKAFNCIITSISNISPAYSINTAFTGLTPDNDRGMVIVGGTGDSIFDVAYSYNSGASFTQINKPLPAGGNTLVMASSGFRSDGYLLAINSTGMYACSLYTGQNVWEEWWGGTVWPDPVTGLAITRNYSFYFATAATWGSATPYVRYASATAGFDPSISLGSPDKPTTRFRASGGMELDQPVTIYAIDQRHYNPPAGGVWFYTDDLLWSGPRPTSPVNHFEVSCDPVTGRAGNIELKWLPKSISRGYAIQIAKDIDFTLIVAKIGDDYFGPYYTPYDLDKPALYISPGGGNITDANGNTWYVPPLESGRTYYWKVKVQDVCNGDYIKSPWSWRESFVVLPGYKVVSHYPGNQLLIPVNGRISCSTRPVFSWTPYQGAYNYELQLGGDPEMKEILQSVHTRTTGWQIQADLNPDTDYYWRVRAVAEDGKSLSDYSATFCFRTGSEVTAEGYMVEEKHAPYWVWTVICFLSVMITGTLILILKLK